MAYFDNKTGNPYPEGEPEVVSQSWFRRKLTQLGNNIGLNDLYRQQKDYYKLIEQIAPWVGPFFRRAADLNVKQELNAAENQRNNAADSRSSAFEKYQKDNSTENLGSLVSELAKEQEARFERKDSRSDFRTAQRMGQLKTGVLGDIFNFSLQASLSFFSSWWERNKVVSTYKELVQAELAGPREVNFTDLRKSKNPIVHEAARYYYKKAWYRALPDLTGLIRLIPLAFFIFKPELKDKPNHPLWKIAEQMDGMNLLLGTKTMFFTWYAFARQTGSYYAAENLWNKTEGIQNLSGRTMNQNVLPGEFVRWQEIRSLYEALREEQPAMKLAEFTINDPLTSRMFEQASRYLNHTYMPKLFAVSSQNKFQHDLKDKKLTHAMLIDLMGTGGLRVQDAIPSAIRLEVIANQGKNGIKAAMAELRRVDHILQKIQRPERGDFSTQEEAANALHQYFVKLESVAKEFLGEAWPPRYIEKEIVPGYVSYYFNGKTPAPEIVEKLNAAIANSGLKYDETGLSEADIDRVAERVAEKLMQQRQQLSLKADTHAKNTGTWVEHTKSSVSKSAEKAENFVAVAAANNNISLVK